MSVDNTHTNHPVRSGNRWIEQTLKLVALIGGFILFLIMALVSVAVYFRYILNSPILGDTELVEIGMSLVVMMAMPFVTLTNSHIRVDVLDRFIGSAGRFIGDIFARLISCFVLGLLVLKTWDKTLEAIEYEDVTNMIELPVWIPYGAITVGFGLTVLVLLGQLVRQIQQGWKDYE